jgi:hypothetical protein
MQQFSWQPEHLVVSDSGYSHRHRRVQLTIYVPSSVLRNAVISPSAAASGALVLAVVCSVAASTCCCMRPEPKLMRYQCLSDNFFCIACLSDSDRIDLVTIWHPSGNPGSRQVQASQNEKSRISGYWQLGKASPGKSGQVKNEQSRILGYWQLGKAKCASQACPQISQRGGSTINSIKMCFPSLSQDRPERRDYRK